MQGTNYITIISNRKKITIGTDSILYVLVTGKIAEIHVLGDKVYQTRMTLGELEEILGDDFIKVHRGCLVSAMAIHDVTKNINLINGESLEYTVRKKTQITDQLHVKQKSIIKNFIGEGTPTTEEEYHRYYISFDNMPFAFTDIEMVFDDERHAIDWIFRYGNHELASLEKIPLSGLIGKSFGSLFENMDSKWLRCYERATLYGEKLEMIDYSPEIHKYIKVICFPTFKGHCGCILFDVSEIQSAKKTQIPQFD